MGIMSGSGPLGSGPTGPGSGFSVMPRLYIICQICNIIDRRIFEFPLGMFHFHRALSPLNNLIGYFKLS